MQISNSKTILTAAMLCVATLASAHEGVHPESGEGKAVIQSVLSGSPAAAAGLEDGDRLLSVAGREIRTDDDLLKVMAAHRPGDTVPLTVERDGETVELKLTFGERPGGGVSIGISYAILAGATPPGEGLTRDECLAWVDATYRLDDVVSDLGFELEGGPEATRELRACLAKDIQRMPSPMPQGWCDNAFKVHCSGLHVLTEIGEAQIERCGQLLGAPLDSCAAQKVYDRYTRNGEASDEAACRAARDACSKAGS